MTHPSFKELFLPLLLVIGAFLVLLAVRGLAFKLLHRSAEQNGTKIKDIILSTFKAPSLYWCVAVALIAGLEVSALPHKYVLSINKAIHVIIIFSITIASANLLSKILGNYISGRDVPIPSAGIVFGVLKGLVLVVGMLIILGTLGISVTPLLTALGVGGLAVALALQDTLSNLFAGLHIIASKQVRPGDYVRLSTGEEGFVTDITWRNTSVKALSNSMIIVPNSKFASSIITNFELPDRETAFSVPVTVSYGSDLEKVERIALETAREVTATTEGGVSGYTPSVRYTQFGDFGIQFGVNLRTNAFADQYLMRHQFIKALSRRFEEEGVRFACTGIQAPGKESGHAS